jgi:hypothetical protein
VTPSSTPKHLCFVVSPIGAPGGPERVHADWLLKGIIEPVFDEHFKEYNVERADKINVPRMIDSQVINRLLDARLVIADMSLLNANAFYEMGIRHMRQLPIIHMYREGDRIPFDVAPYRAIPFSYSHPDELIAAREALKKSVDEIHRDGYQVENPVTRARGLIQLQEHATPSQKVLLDAFSEMERRITALESRRTEIDVRQSDIVEFQQRVAARKNSSPESKEPSMEEILASIRRIIAEDDKNKK